MSRGHALVKLVCALALAALALPGLARSEPTTDVRRAVAVAAAVVPGVLTHGAGHFVAKQPKTGARLLLLGGIGLGTLSASLAAATLSGGSRRVIAPLTAGVVLGAGLFVVSLLADVYGVSVPERVRGAAPRRLPWLTAEGGVFYRYDPLFAGRFLLSNAIDGIARERHHLRLELQTVPAGDSSLRARGLYGARVWKDGGGSVVDLEAAAVQQRSPTDHFSRSTFEAAVRARLDLLHVGPTLRGAYAEARLGSGVTVLNAGGLDADLQSLLLARIAMGAYLGKGCGDVELFYDHRRDTFAGGLVLPGIVASYLGHVGARASYFVTRQIGVQADAQVGSALLAGASLLIRHGSSP